MSVFSNIVAAGLEMGQSVRAEAVTYRTANGDEATVQASPRKPRSSNKMIRAEALDAGLMDWVIAVTALKINGVLWEPRRGDQIDWQKGENVLTFDVLPQDGESHFEPRDSGRSQWRIHSKLVGQEDA